MSQHAFFTLSPTMLAPPSLSGAHTLAPPSPHRARRDARAALATGRAVSLLELTAGPTEFSGSSPIALPHTPQSALAPTSSSYSSSVSLPSEPASDASWRMRARRRGRRVRRHALWRGRCERLRARWRGRRERGGRQCKNRVLRQRSACALFPALYPTSRPFTDIRHHARGGCGLIGAVACHRTRLRQLIQCRARDGAYFGRPSPSPLHKHHEAHNRSRLQVARGPAPYSRHV